MSERSSFAFAVRGNKVDEPSPQLLLADTSTPEQMRLVNTACRFVEAAT